MPTARKPLPPHWYKIYVGECPVCGRNKSYRERMFTPRPEGIEDRYEYLQETETYDYCNAF